jgi:hypothetical protein
MKSITVHSSVGEDGILKLNLPLELKNAELEVMVIFQAVEKQKPLTQSFLENTYGAFRNEPLERPSQGGF